MRANPLLIASVCLNMVLAVGFAVVSRRQAAPSGSATVVTNTSTVIKPAILVRKQFFDWSELESADYAAYIANLRAVNCPEQTIRDIIVADVEQLFEGKDAELRNGAASTDMEWWKRGDAHERTATYWQGHRQLSVERSALLTKLLGPGWERIQSSQRRTLLCLGGPILSAVAPATKQRIIELSAHLDESMLGLRQNLHVNESLDGLSPGEFYQRESAKLTQAARAEIQSLLTPQQLEEYDLRNSDFAQSLRSRTPDSFNMTPEEFRRLFRGTAESTRLLAELELGDESDPEVARRIAAMKARLESEQIAALGGDRAAEWTRMQDDNYLVAMSLAEEYTNASPATLQALFDINKAAVAEATRYNDMTNMTDLQREIAVKRVELAQLEAQARALGQPVPEGSASVVAPVLPPEDTTSPEQPPRPTQRPHTIRIGDTLGSIASAYGLPVNAILSANPGLQLTQLRPGQVIMIPIAPAPAVGSGR
jgi:LysM repeat protein